MNEPPSAYSGLSKKYGMFRGSGSVAVDNDGISVSGSHVMSMGMRWGIGLLMIIASAIITQGAFVLGWIPIFLLMEYVFLKSAMVRVSWNDLENYHIDTKRGLVGLTFQGSEWTSPVMFEPHSGRTWRNHFSKLSRPKK